MTTANRELLDAAVAGDAQQGKVALASQVSLLLVVAEDMTQDDLRQFGWEEKHVNNGLIADVDYFVFFAEDEPPYSFMRHFTGSYEKKEDLTFRGVVYGSALCVWCG